MEIIESRAATVGGLGVRRALPTRGRRTVGAWCFADHMGPLDVDDRTEPGIGPHPHTGLATVTWLLDGELLHRDSLGSEQPIRPGQLNLMTAGGGVQHAEEGTGLTGTFEGIQLFGADQPAVKARIWKGEQSEVGLGRHQAIAVAVPSGKAQQLTTQVERPDPLVAPVAKDQAVGTLKVMLEGQPINTVQLVALEAVPQAGFFGRMWDSLRMWFSKLF